jgi:hypothetical protein
VWPNKARVDAVSRDTKTINTHLRWSEREGNGIAEPFDVCHWEIQRLTPPFTMHPIPLYAIR